MADSVVLPNIRGDGSQQASRSDLVRAVSDEIAALLSRSRELRHQVTSNRDRALAEFIEADKQADAELASLPANLKQLAQLNRQTKAAKPVQRRQTPDLEALEVEILLAAANSNSGVELDSDVSDLRRKQQELLQRDTTEETKIGEEGSSDEFPDVYDGMPEEEFEAARFNARNNFINSLDQLAAKEQELEAQLEACTDDSTAALLRQSLGEVQRARTHALTTEIDAYLSTYQPRVRTIAAASSAYPTQSTAAVGLSQITASNELLASLAGGETPSPQKKPARRSAIGTHNSRRGGAVSPIRAGKGKNKPPTSTAKQSVTADNGVPAAAPIGRRKRALGGTFGASYTKPSRAIAAAAYTALTEEDTHTTTENLHTAGEGDTAPVSELAAANTTAIDTQRFSNHQ